MSYDKHGNVWRFRCTRNGVQYKMNWEGPDNKVEKAHAAFLVDVERGSIGSNENMKFVDLCQLVMDQYVKVKCSYNTVQNYKNYYNNHIIPFFGNKKVSSITSLCVDKFIKSLNDSDLSATTINGIASTLRKTFELALKWDVISKSPCTAMDTPPRKKYTTRSQLMTIDEMTTLINIYNNLSSKPSRMHKLAFYIALGCGLRNSEIRALTLDDIDFKSNTIKVTKQAGRYLEKGETIDGNISPKTDSSIRTIYAPDFVMVAIKNYINELDYIPISKQLFFSPRTNKPVGRQCLSTFFTNILKDNNLPIIDFHDLRHLHATLLAAKGVNVKTLAARMGHSKIETTNVYMQTIEEVDKQVANTLDDTIKDLRDSFTL